MFKNDKKQKKDDQKKDENLEELLQKAEQDSQEKDDQENESMTRDEELNQYKEQAMRAMADLQNVKKRMDAEKKDFTKYASQKLLTSLLPVLDNFKRAFDHIPDEIKGNDWINGVTQIESTFVKVLQQEGLEEIPSNTKDDFNADIHECLMQDPEVSEGKISQCLEVGYMIKGKVLRPSKVSVGSA
jgi:molecular chaperone GrpE